MLNGPQKELQTGSRLAWGNEAERLSSFKPSETAVIADILLV